MGKSNDITGQTFNQLTVVGIAGKANDGHVLWEVLCTCGLRTRATASKLKSGNTKSCGCFRTKQLNERNYKHGAAVAGKKRGRTYNIWRNMLWRCTNTRRPDYKHYGGRGIMVCEEWMRYADFLADMGECPEGMSIDRIDVDGNYEKENCRWADAATQARNKRVR